MHFNPLLWSRPVKLGSVAITALVLTITVAACGSSATHAGSVIDPNGQACAALAGNGYCPGDAPAAESSSSPSPSPSAPPLSPSGPSCTQQTQAWLAEQDGSGISGNTVQHDIDAIVFDAKAYQKYDPGNTGAGENFLKFLNFFVTSLTYTATPNAPPSCADPNELWGAGLTSGTFLGDASNSTNDTAGTSQADSDVQAVLTDFGALQGEVKANTGVQVKEAASP